MSSLRSGRNLGYEGPSNGGISPRRAIIILEGLIREGAETVKSVRPNGTEATFDIRKGPWRSVINEIRDPRNTIEF